MSQKLVSIIIVNWNGGKVLEDCLNSLEKISYKNWQLVFVDNGSNDGSDAFPEKILTSLKISIIKNKENLGFAYANNQGFEKAKGEYILLLNNDTVVTTNFLSILVDKMNLDSSLGVTQPKIYMLDKKGYLDNAGSFITRIGFWDHWGFGEKDSQEFNIEKEIFSAKGACMLIRKSVIEKVDLFDPDFVSYFEESDFCWRVWLAGYRVLYYPKSHIYHKVGFTIKRQNVLNINFHYYKNRICSLIKNLEILNLLITLSSHLFISLGIAFIFLVRGNRKGSIMIIQAIMWNIININKTLNKRVHVQKTRKISDRQLFKNLLHPVNWIKFFRDFKRVEEDINK